MLSICKRTGKLDWEEWGRKKLLYWIVSGHLGVGHLLAPSLPLPSDFASTSLTQSKGTEDTWVPWPPCPSSRAPAVPTRAVKNLSSRVRQAQ